MFITGSAGYPQMFNQKAFVKILPGFFLRVFVLHVFVFQKNAERLLNTVTQRHRYIGNQ